MIWFIFVMKLINNIEWCDLRVFGLVKIDMLEDCGSEEDLKM